ncbi:Class II aldolase/adducin N-terminal [Syntrophomonas zehnderi OL-4]|uniref:Class II aldolase/adducin N-terminal n=1 Tax=Syntrophomonas zehnderi OL-4 TaxID=690567 RepID=A0A0E4GFB7_9FIRM|nr:class II aldolase/adducin family protein [Syntrophomonas zehnderi]CFY05762.1 Class II aldolase/adducin N-terminal [Syntrophomonas zehnderi OL-4]
MRYLQDRKAVLRTAREIYEQKLVPGTWGNVSQKVKNESFLLITPSGMDYRLMTIEDIILLDMDANVIEGEHKPSIETQLHIHIYKSRPDVRGVVHVHSTYASAFAVANKSIPVILEETAQVIGHPVEVAPYARCGSLDLAHQAVRTLGDGQAVLLANHGLVGVGVDVEQALNVCNIAEKTAMVSLYANTLGQVKELGREDIDILRQEFSCYGQS